MGGKTLWVVGTSVLLLGVPWALAYADEQQMIEMEKEYKMQQSAGDVSFSSPLQINHDTGFKSLWNIVHLLTISHSS
jgi:hypothetical protein